MPHDIVILRQSIHTARDISYGFYKLYWCCHDLFENTLMCIPDQCIIHVRLTNSRTLIQYKNAILTGEENSLWKEARFTNTICFPILLRWHLYIESASMAPFYYNTTSSYWGSLLIPLVIVYTDFMKIILIDSVAFISILCRCLYQFMICIKAETIYWTNVHLISNLTPNGNRRQILSFFNSLNMSSALRISHDERSPICSYLINWCFKKRTHNLSQTNHKKNNCKQILHSNIMLSYFASSHS